MKSHYSMDLQQINWAQFDTAYGTAESIPDMLAALLSEDEGAALKNASELESYLCHQHVQIGSASVPALPFLLKALTKCSTNVASKILFVLAGFALGSQDGFWRQEPDWMAELIAGLRKNLHLVEPFLNSDNEDASYHASQILDILQPIERFENGSTHDT